ncbi:glycosyltransferase family 4 protein [Vibrio owensii]|uniref:glycosyltransferase family 4 protein n=1 Tax=Vibrio owensii TaxID=696485 RepID=UPI002F42900C
MILYIGNKSRDGINPTTIDALANKLGEYCDIVTCSNKKNIMFRMIDMLYSIFKHRNSIDFVLIDTYSTSNFYYAFFCSQLCRILSLRYINILHGGSLPARIKKSKFMSSLIFKNAYKLVSPSLYLQNEFKKKGYNAIFLPNYIDVNEYNYRFRCKSKKKLIYVRAISRTYNPIMLARAVKILISSYPEIHVDLVGPNKLDGEYEEIIKYIDDNSLQKNFTLHGFLTKEEWKKLAAECDIFINTTNVDNMPLTVIEAMALGLPIISTNVGGIPYMINDYTNGLLVEPNDHNMLADKISELFEDEVLYRKISKNVEVEIIKYDWNNIAHRWAAILNFEVK